MFRCCIVFYLYSTSNHNRRSHRSTRRGIVFYLYSTSNHNVGSGLSDGVTIVFYLYSTSNHNRNYGYKQYPSLSFISILHQTTTLTYSVCGEQELSFISILHQTTTGADEEILSSDCLLSLFYIKPQLACARRDKKKLSFISILHQTTTSTSRALRKKDCLLSLFYIKPQQRPLLNDLFAIVFYLYSTSNHNVYFLILLFTDICVHSYVHEVVKTYYLLCKITKKILTAMGSALIFSLWLPKCE